ncbi:MAG: ADP-ribosylglycohydrolase family protein [Actinobacteria bacterium]|nr:ADP-ribosylglycohydrolase family protein [Actinomycetota bacterium]MCB8997250.1 ADP-ribosylglycohydrolase family protein [Actinomycetota bacterium]MCB9414610.1 ADP-ribosylglycohydrolase family protein [Actinomycetota bacterium]MCB9423562.1 ADP-ribosylglycohydrolase family protein [Actinomycetota bacterium]
MLLHMSTAQRDRAVGAMVGLAVGDALGAGYEFASPVPPHEVAMIGGGIGDFAPGEWTDDTSMAIPILQAVAAGLDLDDVATQDRVVGAWIHWTDDAKDVGVTTRASLRGAAGRSADAVRDHARSRFEAGVPGAGNGTLMRTTPIVFAHLSDPDGLTHTARLYSDLTHGDPEAADACVLWNHAQRHAILHAEFDLAIGVDQLPAERRDLWLQRIHAAEAGQPGDFTRNGWVVEALQCAWSAIVSTPLTGPEHFESAIRAAVAAGWDTDTVAAIAGSLLGARWGVSAIPLDWRRRVHGWPDLTGQDLVRLTSAAVTGEEWPTRLYDTLRAEGPPVALAADPGVWIGDVFGLEDLPEQVTAVVSLCRLGSQQLPDHIDTHVEVWLIDSPAQEENPHLEFVTRDTVDLIRRLRDEGETVYVHCVQAHSRTPFIAALYTATVTGLPGPTALEQVCAQLPSASPNRAFRAHLDAV